MTDRKDEQDCVYRPGAVNCADRTRCAKCGWAPAVEAERKAKLKQKPPILKKPK